MPHYAVSFELKNNSTYGDRYNSLMAQIRKSPSNSVWTETTSFALVETTESLTAFADRLYISSEVNAIWDKLVVIDHLNGKAIARGPIDYPHTLKSHFKSCEIR